MPGTSPGAAPVAVAVVSWNTRERLRACLTSLQDDARAGRAEVWVVDNASTDGSADVVGAEFPWARLIASAENLGFGPAVNLVAERTSSPWLAVANADVEVTPQALLELLRAGHRHPQAGILAPRLLLPDGSLQHSVHRFPTLGYTLAFNLLFALGLAARWPRLAERMLLEGHWDGRHEGDVDWAVGAFLLVRRAAWETAGGFDAQMWMYAEDLDLAWRARRAGWSTWYVPGAVVRHHRSAAVHQAWGEEEVEPRWMRSTYAWMVRRRGPTLARAVALTNVAGATLRYLLLTPLAAVAPARWSWQRRQARRWAQLHAAGLGEDPGDEPA